MKRLLFSIIITVFVSSCTIRPIAIKKVSDLKIKEYSAKGATVEFKMLVDNPNSLGFKIYKSNLKVKINNIELGSADIAKKIKIGRKSEKEYVILLKSDFSSVSPAMLMTLMQLVTSGKNNVAVSVSGEFKAGNLFYKRTFPVELKQNINISR
jgi:LEA14-like dessication related protein